MPPRNSQLSIDSIIAAARPVQRTDIFAKAKKIAESLGEGMEDTDEHGFISALVFSNEELMVSYYLWGDLNNHGFGVVIFQGEEQVFSAGTERISLYKPGPWEKKLDKIHKPYLINN